MSVFYSNSSNSVNSYRCLTPTTKGVLYSPMTFGIRLKNRRIELGLTQIALAEKSGISQQMISKLERGAAYGTTELLALARALEVTPEWFSEIDGPTADGKFSVVVSSEEMEFLQDFRAIPNEDRPTYRRVIKRARETAARYR